MRKLDTIQATLLATTAHGALTNLEKHKVEKDYILDLTGENALGKPATEWADAQKEKPFHD